MIKCYSYLKSNDNHLLLLEYCNGGSLEHFLKLRAGRLAEENAHYILRQLINGIKDQNEKRIMHRDMKPANVGIVFVGKKFQDNEQRDLYIRNFDFDFQKDGAILHVKILDYG